MEAQIESILSKNDINANATITLAYTPLNFNCKYKMNTIPNPSDLAKLTKNLKKLSPVTTNNITTLNYRDTFYQKVNTKVNTIVSYFRLKEFLLIDQTSTKTYILSIKQPLSEYDLPISSDLQSFSYTETSYCINDIYIRMLTANNAVFRVLIETKINIASFASAISRLNDIVNVLF